MTDGLGEHFFAGGKGVSREWHKVNRNLFARLNLWRIKKLALEGRLPGGPSQALVFQGGA